MLFILFPTNSAISVMFPKASYANGAVDHLSQEKYLVFEGLICEKEGWSDNCLKRVSCKFDRSRFRNIKAFYVLELQHLGFQVYRANNANPVSSILLLLVFGFLCHGWQPFQDWERTLSVMSRLRSSLSTAFTISRRSSPSRLHSSRVWFREARPAGVHCLLRHNSVVLGEHLLVFGTLSVTYRSAFLPGPTPELYL